MRGRSDKNMAGEPRELSATMVVDAEAGHAFHARPSSVSRGFAATTPDD